MSHIWPSHKRDNICSARYEHQTRCSFIDHRLYGKPLAHHHHHRVARPWQDIAVSTSLHHLERSCARFHAELRPRLCCWRSSSIVRSQVRLGRPGGHCPSTGWRLMAARRAREWSWDGPARASCLINAWPLPPNPLPVATSTKIGSQCPLPCSFGCILLLNQIYLTTMYCMTIPLQFIWSICSGN